MPENDSPARLAVDLMEVAERAEKLGVLTVAAILNVVFAAVYQDGDLRPLAEHVLEFARRRAGEREQEALRN